MPELLLCQRDANARELAAEVVDCSAEGTVFWATVADSVLYPEGGGQPADHGWLGGQRVHDVQKGPDGRVRVRLDHALAPGVHTQRVDWDRRFDHMQQHTGQHLLTALAHAEFGWQTTSFHLHAERADIELDTPKVSAAQLRALEDQVNQAIRDALPVRAQVWASRAAAPEAVRSRGLPEDHTGPLRVVEIAGLDHNTCGGTHVAHTGELQCLKILGSERLRGGTRVHFLVGGRVLDQLETHQRRAAALRAQLRCADAEVGEIVGKLQAQAKEAKKALGQLRAELAGLLGPSLAQTAPDHGLRHLHRSEADLGVLGAIARGVPEDGQLLLLTGGADHGDGVFLLRGPPDRVTALGPKVAACMGGRGGGRGGRFQGKVTAVERRAAALECCRDADPAT